MDSYISDELLIETNHDVLRHLENCPGCRNEMSDRRELKMRLRQTFRGAAETQIDPIFAARMTTNLRDLALRPGAWTRLTGDGRFLNVRTVAVSFACILVLVLGGVIWLYQPPMSALNTEIQNTNTNVDLAKAVRVSWSELTTQAVGDHENCAVEFHLKEVPITLDEAAINHGAYNKDLDKVMMAAFKADPSTLVSADTEFIESHSCVYEGRRFAHIVVRHKGKMVSLLVTETVVPAGNLAIQTAKFDRAMNSAGFQVGEHAVFIVSQLADGDNVTLAKAVAPAMRLHVEKPGA